MNIPQVAEVTETPITNINNRETAQVIFFAGDDVSDRTKKELTFTQFGGVFLPHLKTLRESKGMLYRCQLTRLAESAQNWQWHRMLDPSWADGEKYRRGFTQTKKVDGQIQQKVVDGFIESDPNESKKGNFVGVKSDHIVYHKRYAGDEALEATKLNPPHGPAGIVKIDVLEGASPLDVAEAQLFFFPNWNEIRAGIEELPNDIRDLIKHLEARRTAIRNEVWSEEKINQYLAIADAMLRSAREWSLTAREAVRSDERIFNNVGKLDERITHSPMSEKYMEMTGTTRQTDMLMNQSGSVQDLVKEMQAQRQGDRELEERKLFLEEVKLGIRNPDGSLVRSAPLVVAEVPTLESETTTAFVMDEVKTPVFQAGDSMVSIPVPEFSTEVKLCGQPKKDGEPCRRTVMEGKDTCPHHEEKSDE